MITPLLSLLLAVKLVSHSGQVPVPSGERFTWIIIRNCKGNIPEIYMDRRGVIDGGMGNGSYATDYDGRYEFWTESPYIVLNIGRGREEYDMTTIRTCKEPEKTHK